jgi:hypothetical protein
LPFTFLLTLASGNDLPHANSKAVDITLQGRFFPEQLWCCPANWEQSFLVYISFRLVKLCKPKISE